MGVLIFAACINPVSASRCSFHITKWTDKNGNGVFDGADCTTDPVGPACEGVADWEFKVTAPAGKPAACTISSISTQDDGVAHAFLNNAACSGGGYTIEEIDSRLGPGGWTPVDPVSGIRTSQTCTTTSGASFENAPPVVVVPEFPTVAVSFAALVGIGFVVSTVRRRD